MSDALNFKRAESTILLDFNLTNSQQLKLLTLLERGVLCSEAFIGKGSNDLINLIHCHGHMIKDVETNILYDVKPVYLCLIVNEMNPDKMIKNCELLLNTNNLAVDLLFSYNVAQKFDLVPSVITTDANGFESEMTLVKMLPPLLVKFALKDSSGETEERKASLDVYVNKAEIDLYREGLFSVEQILCPINSPPRSSVKDKLDEDKYDKNNRKRRHHEITSALTEAAPVNEPSPVKYLGTGTANLGFSGAQKLGLKYDAEKKQIFFLPPKKPLPI